MLLQDLQPERVKPIADRQDAIMTLRGHFLIATPAIHRGFFNRSLTYLCRHDESGAMGIVVNQRLDITFIEMAEHLAIPTDAEVPDFPILAGGPIRKDHGKENLQIEYHENYWEQHASLVRERIPRFLEDFAEKILKTGKYLNVVAECGKGG